MGDECDCPVEKDGSCSSTPPCAVKLPCVDEAEPSAKFVDRLVGSYFGVVSKSEGIVTII